MRLTICIESSSPDGSESLGGFREHQCWHSKLTSSRRQAHFGFGQKLAFIKRSSVRQFVGRQFPRPKLVIMNSNLGDCRCDAEFSFVSATVENFAKRGLR